MYCIILMSKFRLCEKVYKDFDTCQPYFDQYFEECLNRNYPM